MIDKALDAGKEVILSTGRSVAELKEYIAQLPGIRYINCCSGAMCYDLKENKSVYSNRISIDDIKKIMKIAALEDVMIQFLTKDSIVQRNQFERLDYYKMGKYIPLFESVAKKVENIYKYYEENPFSAEKINLYHVTPEARERTRRRLNGIEVMMVDAEKTSLELSAFGVSKGIGLESLCQYLNIPIEETIAVGDADNDIEILKTAGLSVAMGNANEKVKSICDVQVTDCDNDGCAEAIEKYLL